MMNLEKSLRAIEDLEAYVKQLEIEEFSKEKILKTIGFEKEFSERQLISELGKREYEKIRKGK